MGEGGYREGKGTEGIEIARKQGPLLQAGREAKPVGRAKPKAAAVAAQSKALQGTPWAQRLRTRLPSAHSWPVSVFR